MERTLPPSFPTLPSLHNFFNHHPHPDHLNHHATNKPEPPSTRPKATQNDLTPPTSNPPHWGSIAVTPWSVTANNYSGRHRGAPQRCSAVEHHSEGTNVKHHSCWQKGVLDYTDYWKARQDFGKLHPWVNAAVAWRRPVDVSAIVRESCLTAQTH